MKGLKLATFAMALYSGSLFGAGAMSVIISGVVTRGDIKLMGLGMIGIAFVLQVSLALARRGY